MKWVYPMPSHSCSVSSATIFVPHLQPPIHLQLKILGDHLQRRPPQRLSRRSRSQRRSRSSLSSARLSRPSRSQRIAHRRRPCRSDLHCRSSSSSLSLPIFMFSASNTTVSSCLNNGKELHSYAIKLGFAESDLFVSNALVENKFIRFAESDLGIH